MIDVFGTSSQELNSSLPFNISFLGFSAFLKQAFLKLQKVFDVGIISVHLSEIFFECSIFDSDELLIGVYKSGYSIYAMFGLVCYTFEPCQENVEEGLGSLKSSTINEKTI